MKISVIKTPSRYERIVVEENLEKLKEFLERRLIKSKIEKDEVSNKLVIFDKHDEPIDVRTGYIIYIYNDIVVSVDIPQFPEFDKLFKMLSKIRNQ